MYVDEPIGWQTFPWLDSNGLHTRETGQTDSPRPSTPRDHAAYAAERARHDRRKQVAERFRRVAFAKRVQQAKLAYGDCLAGVITNDFWRQVSEVEP